jgi:hypothetical protein
MSRNAEFRAEALQSISLTGQPRLDHCFEVRIDGATVSIERHRPCMLDVGLALLHPKSRLRLESSWWRVLQEIIGNPRYS